MKSYQLTAPGAGIDGVVLREHDEPTPDPDQVVVRVAANSVGYRDLQVVAGDYPLPVRPGVVLGCEGTGEVVAVGSRVSRVAVGDRVAGAVFPRWIDGPFSRDNAAQLGTMLDGLLTEYAVLDEDGVVPIPEHLSYAEAATLPLSAVTAWNALTEGRPLRSGETVLTLGSGAVSTFALQFAKLAGARVVVTTSSAEKADKLTALGADAVIDYRRNSQWWQEVRALTGDRGADRVVDATGPLGQSLQAVAARGEIAFVGYWVSGAAGAQPIEPASLFKSGAIVRCVATGSRAHFLALNRAVEAHRLRPVIDRVFGFDEVPQALRYCRSGQGFGKIVITHE
ncbi:NAD(P)-dependent alcohol dehydrogenase [Nocardia sp. NEAU-G5]|uniref:NAD(P)-dependent alcohol dehydrogenase n=1 Tax=Nocardia albiluteola TaxID=2842303 RepID=A0ABS6BC71_9NOCA|nr:NAD(P)-dependent alcohol dehydrogenase [Nocardia albiluteola]MBU3067879.1 NAD(P)-dependent alcohol dehydrogenase [Nocardia albiluteola]